MSIETTQALIPFEGVTQPLPTVMHYEVDRFNNPYRTRPMSTAGYRAARVNSNYGKFGKMLESHSAIGENIDIYV